MVNVATKTRSRSDQHAELGKAQAAFHQGHGMKVVARKDDREVNGKMPVRGRDAQVARRLPGLRVKSFTVPVEPLVVGGRSDD